jgi:hypothetical protein
MDAADRLQGADIASQNLMADKLDAEYLESAAKVDALEAEVTFELRRIIPPEQCRGQPCSRHVLAHDRRGRTP